MIEHTPGPFTTDEKTARDLIYIRNSDGAFLASINKLVGINMHPDEHRANARLFAAAPDLLAACEAVVHFSQRELSTIQYEDAKSVLSKCQAAIAKAKGE